MLIITGRGSDSEPMAVVGSHWWASEHHLVGFVNYKDSYFIYLKVL